jgi:hypothetical protein
MTVAVLAVWRLSRLLFEDGVEGSGWGGASRLLRMRPRDFLGNRVMDCLYWLHVWLSAQTAMWVACGFAGVFLSWVVGAGISRAMANNESRQCRSQETAVPGLQEAAR